MANLYNSSGTEAFVDSLNLLPKSGTASNDPKEIERQASQGRGKCGVEICA